MALFIVNSERADAQIETLVMPGDVIEGHADIEGECGNCHEAFERSKQRALCLDCHDPHSAKLVAGDNPNDVCAQCHLASKFDTPAHHFHERGTPGGACKSCHMNCVHRSRACRQRCRSASRCSSTLDKKCKFRQGRCDYLSDG